MKFPLLITITMASLSGIAAAASSEEQHQRTSITMPLVPHHVQRQRRLDRPEQDAPADVRTEDPFSMKADALYQGYGTHYVDLWVGTPPQRQTVIIDTGSSVTAFPCGDCSNCGSGYHIDSYFQEDNSATFTDVDCLECKLGHCGHSGALCQLSVSYQEGSSWKAYEVTDLLYTGGPHDKAINHPKNNAFQFHFGCQTHLTGLFKTQLADGIAGMEMSPSSLWKQAHTEGAILSQEFSLCFSRQIIADKEGTGAGVMTLGGSDTRLHSSTMVYANQPHDNGWFTVHIRAIYMRRGGGESVVSNNKDATIVKLDDISEEHLNNGAVIVDSGTTDTYLTSYLAGPFHAAYNKIMDGENWNADSQVTLSDEELLAMPTILIQLQGWEGAGAGAGDVAMVDEQAEGLASALDPDNPHDILVAVPPTHYMEYSVKTRKYTPRFYFTESHGGVLGANFMMGHDLHFDVDNYRVGFAESDCDYQVVADDETEESG